MAVALKTIGFLHLKRPENQLSLLRGTSQVPTLAVKRFTPMAALTAAPTVGLSETFKRLKEQGQVCIPLAINPLYDMGFSLITLSYYNFFFFSLTGLSVMAELAIQIPAIWLFIQSNCVEFVEF